MSFMLSVANKSIMPSVIILSVVMLNVVAPARGLYYKTFYGRNLRIFVIRVFVPGKPLQLSLMLVGQARSLP